MEYYYNIGKTLVNAKNFRLILVKLEPPYPENKPGEDEQGVQGEVSTEGGDSAKPNAESQEDVAKYVEALKKMWGAKQTFHKLIHKRKFD